MSSLRAETATVDRYSRPTALNCDMVLLGGVMSSSNRSQPPGTPSVPSVSTEATAQQALPRLGSAPDNESGTSTFLSEVCGELARLSDRQSVPRLTRLVTADVPLTPEESFILSLVGTNISVANVVQRSPLTEDETLHFLARMITTGLIEIPK
jgi:hypothetical protein